MASGSGSARVSVDFDLAERQRGRRDPDGGLQFASVRHAVHFCFERGEAMQGPLGRHPRGQLAADGSTVVLAVDGGRGGSIDDVLATLQTIHDALDALRRADPRAYELYVRHVVGGETFADLGKTTGLAPSTCSGKVGQAEYFLLGRLQGDVVIAPVRAA